MKYEEDYPRTLIVGAYFSEQSGSGTFLGRLFSNWPTDRVAAVCGGISSPDWLRCSRYYQTGDLEFRIYGSFKRFLSIIASGTIHPSAMVVTPVDKVSRKISLSRRLAQYAWRAFLRLLGGGEILYDVGPSLQLLEWVQDFQPEIIYGHFSSLNSLRFLSRLQQALDIPLVLHFMDDWPATLYRDNWLSCFLRPRYLTEFAALVGSSSVAIAICKEMAEEYEQRYHRPVLSLPMPVEMDGYLTTARKQRKVGQPFRLRYGGRVGWAIRESLGDLAQAIHSLRQNGADVTFDIATFQTEQVTPVCYSSSGVNVHTPGPLAEMPQMQAEADILIICYDFDQESFLQARYSMPSKLGDCMASGTPILVYGPAGLPVVEYARREGWGKIVDRRDPNVLRAAICELMESESLRGQLGEKAKHLTTEIHDAKVVSESFRTILQGAIDRKAQRIMF